MPALLLSSPNVGRSGRRPGRGESAPTIQCEQNPLQGINRVEYVATGNPPGTIKGE